MSERDAQSRSPIGWKLVALVIVVAVGTLAWFRLAPVPIGPWPMPLDGKKLSSAEVARAVELKNDAIALMENWKFDLATEKLTELELLAPGESLVLRNRAIAAVLAISPEALDKTRNPEEFQKGYARAEEAVTRLQTADPEWPVSYLLAARLAEHRDDHGEAIRRLETAAKLSDSAPAFEVEVYLASRMVQTPEAEASGLIALMRAAEANTDNLWVLAELAVSQAIGQEAETKQTLIRLREVIRPFTDFIKQLRRFDIDDLLTKALTAIEQKDWDTVKRNVRIVSNLLRPEIATKLDLKRVVKHPLEYASADFSADWQRKYGEAIKKTDTQAAASLAVTFAEADAADQLPPLAGIRDVKIADFDLDGRWDVIVLLNGQVIVFGQAKTNSNEATANRSNRWVTLCEAVVPSGLTKLVACDLDRDSEETPEDHSFIGQPVQPGTLLEGATPSAEDADIDLLVFGEEGAIFLRNEFDAAAKSRSLKALPQDAKFEELRAVLAIVPADIDHDGDLDLIVSTGLGMSIWQNNDSREHTKFIDISSRSALPPNDLKATVLLAVDWNFDLQTDVLVSGPNVEIPGYLENISHGRLRWRELPASSLLAKAHALRLAEIQVSPLSWNLFASTDKAVRHLSGSPHQVSEEAIFTDGISGFTVSDIDNDGTRDWLPWGLTQAWRRLRHQGTAAAASKPEEISLLKQPVPLSLCDVADFDADGDEDVLIVTDQRAVWIRNDGGNKNGWLDLSIRADKDRKPQRDAERTNIHGVGSWVELRGSDLPETSNRKQHVHIVDGQSTHFGLGSAKQVDAARIVWTNGVPQNILRPRSGEAIAAQQFLKGSCPYLYTWDGEEWAFFTDCLWAAPIGLQFAEGVLATPREWEYLQINGDRLPEINGEYRLMLTEELWEAAYFDQVRLLAIDHPADVELYSNEKVGPPSIAEFKLHPVRKRHVPVAAHDHRGRDVLDKLAKRDERYLRAFDKIIQQGLAEEHFIELDLGDLSDARSATLFLTGWIFPTDTSINVSLSQNPDRDAPKPPSIWVVDDAGEANKSDAKWREAIPYIGFPGGKTKTIAVDLSEALGLGQRDGTDLKSTRIRIVTSMELYWDEMFFTVNEPDVEHSITPMPMLSADLQYRGFSARLPHPEFGPERYDAADVSTAPQWPPMGGKFTRYGDVKELLTEADDRLAILGAGDAVTIRFQAETSRDKLPAGWKRDFILHNVGYDKDADLNTVYGQFVEPLPFRAMRGYPDPTGAEYPDSDAHRDYLRRFQTREQSRAKFWNGGIRLGVRHRKIQNWRDEAR